MVGSSNDTVAEYRYTVAGHHYQNARVYVAAFKDNIGSYRKDMTRQLKDLKNNNQSVNIWYNPNQPGESVIDRNMRWGLFALMTGFCGVFVLIGLAVCYGSLTYLTKKQTDYHKPSLSELRREWKQKQSDKAYNEVLSTLSDTGAMNWKNRQHFR